MYHHIKKCKKPVSIQVFGLLVLLLLSTSGQAQTEGGSPIDIPTAFQYQGELIFNGSPANGSFEVTFALFDQPAAGMDFMFAETSQTIFATDGWFSTEVDFGFNVFFGQRAWLEVSVVDPVSLDEFILGPRMPINAVPYAMMADQVRIGGVNADSIADFSILNNHIQNNVLLLSKLHPSNANINDVIQYDGSNWVPAPLALDSPWQTLGDDIHYINGRVGVGTFSPDSKLHLHGTVDDELRISGFNGVPALHFRRNSNGADWYLKIDPESNEFYFQAENDSVEKIMTIKPSGEITRNKQVKTLYLGFEAFTPTASTHQYEVHNFLGMTGLKATQTGVGPAEFFTDVPLPADANITAFEMMAGDNSPAGAVIAHLGFRGFGATNGGLVIETLTSTNSPFGAVHSAALDHSVGADRSHYVLIELDAVNSASQDVIFAGVRITYETTVL